MLCYIACNWVVLHATNSLADAVVRCASGLCEANIGAGHSEQGPCTVRDSETLLTYTLLTIGLVCTTTALVQARANITELSLGVQHFIYKG